MNSDEEGTPVGAAAIGQRSAFAAMVDQYQQQLGNYLIHLTGNQHVALAVTRETFVCAHHADLVSRPATTPSAWLYGMATRLALRHLRLRSPAQFAPHRLACAAVGPGCPDTWDSGMIVSVLSQLQPSERAVLLLCDLEQRSFDEAAVILGTSTERAQRRLARARARFRLGFLAQHAMVSSSPAGSVTS